MIGIGVGIDYALFIVTRYRARAAPHGVAGGRGARSDEHLGPGRGLRRLHRDDLGARHAAHGPAASCTASPSARRSRSWSRCSPPSRCCPRCSASSASPSTGSRSVAGQQRSGETMWHRWARSCSGARRSIAFAGFAVLFVAIASRVRSCASAAPTRATTRSSSTTHKAYDLIAQGFGPGANGPILVVADTPHAGLRRRPAAARRRAARDARRRSRSATRGRTRRARPRSRRCIPTTRTAGRGDAAARPPTCATTSCPQATAGTGLSVHLGGQTASNDRLRRRDRRAACRSSSARVLALSFLLLLLVFRSVLVPLKAVLMNLLSIGAAYGVIVADLPVGLGRRICSASSTAPIEAWVPMMLFAIVFGLSMDYEVFLLERGPRALRPHRRQRDRRRRRAREHRARHHRGRADHGVRVRQLRRRPTSAR